jgi:hypothetical protein
MPNAKVDEFSNVSTRDRRMTDRFTAKVLRGAEALEYAKRLRKVGVDAERWEIEYIDDGTGDRWLLDYPETVSAVGWERSESQQLHVEC